MGTTQSAALPTIDVETWRCRIRQDTSAHYHVEMGAAIEREGNPAAAMEAYRRALAVRPDLAVASYRLIQLLAMADRSDEADAVRRNACAIDEGFEFKAARAIAVDLIGRNDTVGARALLEQARQRAPDDPSIPCLLELCLWFEGTSVLRSADRPAGIDDDTAESIGQLYSALGIRKLDERDRSQARLCFRAALNFYPDMTANEYLGRLEHEDGNLEEAIRLIRASVRQTAKEQSLELLGDMLMQANRADEAEPLFRRLTERTSCSPYAWTKLGIAAMALEHFDEAVRSFRAGLDADAQMVEAHVNLALVLLPLGQAAEAETHLRFALSKNPANGSNHVHLGATLLLSGRYAEAEAAFRAGHGMMGGSAWPLAWVALVRLFADDMDTAASVVGQAIAQEPGSPWAHSIRGLVQHAQGRFTDAAASHAEALALSGAAPWLVAWIQGNAAVTMAVSGDPAGAAAAAQTAARAAPAWFSYQQSIRPEWARSVLTRLLPAFGAPEN